MKRAIVCGGAGFVGSAVVEALVNHGVDVCAVVKPGFRASPECFRLDGLDIHIIECDLRNICELEHLLPWKSADVFYQFAWEGLSAEKMTDYVLQINNIKWMLDAIVVAAKLKCKKFIGAGTISQDELATPEGRKYQGDRHRIFRSAALTCEYMGQSVAYEQNIEFIWPIISNVYGEGELSPRLITDLIQRLILGKSMDMSSGEQNYDFIYRTDAGEAYYLLGKFGKPNRRYNIASGEARSLKEYLCQINEIIAPEVELGWGCRTTSGIALDEESFDISALQEDTGFRPEVSFAEGIRRTAAWIAEQEQVKE